MFLNDGHFMFGHRHRYRHQQGLQPDALGHPLFQSLVYDAFVRCVHVNQHQALLILRQDVDSVQLRQCLSQRHVVSGQGGGCQRAVGHQGRSHFMG